MTKRLFAFSLALLLLFAIPVSATEINPALSSMYMSSGLTPQMEKPITRAVFCMLAFESFRQINDGVFPQMEAQNPFSDVGDAPEDIFVVMLYGMGVVNGTSETTFEPRRPITRQEAAAILFRAKLRQNPDFTLDAESNALYINTFSDAESTAPWASSSMGYLVQAGVLPLLNGMLSPISTLTTKEAMLLCTRFIAL